MGPITLAKERYLESVSSHLITFTDIFGPLQVFKICWTEPAGRGRPANGTEKVRTKYGEDCYTSIRRFVVIDKRDGHSLCLLVNPISCSYPHANQMVLDRY
jgi:hypothetical protein